MKGEKPDMEREEYTPSGFRAGLNVYGGMVLGALAPIVATRYTMCQDDPTFLAWFEAAFLSVASLATPVCAAVGTAIGYKGLGDLSRRKNEKLAEQRERESVLEEL